MIDNSAMFKLSYGMFVLTASDGGKDNGCVINTVTQVTDTPRRISIAVNKGNLTHDMVMSSGAFNVSVLTENVPFSLIQHFGFKKGREVDKFKNYAGKRSENGIYYIDEYTNSYISAKVIQSVDLGTHTVFIADVTEAAVLSEAASATYSFYFDHIKPKPEKKVKGYVCKICGYVYEGEELPPDFVCPICGHGADDFEAVE